MAVDDSNERRNMCKIFTLLGFEDSEILLDLAASAIPYLSQNDADGLGMIGCTKDNKIWVEKHLFNDTAFRVHDLKDRRYFQKIGKFDDKLDSLVIHTRMACSEVNIQNTHPFSAKGVHLVHNGVVDEHELQLKKSTCDSEGILNLYNDLNIRLKPSNWKYLYDYLNGWYACVAVMKWKGKIAIDVFKNDGANLYEVSIEGMNGRILCTDKTHAENVLRINKLKVANIEQFCEDALCRFMATGEPVIMETDIKEIRGAYNKYYGTNDNYYGTGYTGSSSKKKSKRANDYMQAHEEDEVRDYLNEDTSLVNGYDIDQYGRKWSYNLQEDSWTLLNDDSELEKHYGRVW